jgi:hypothetical protein
LLTARVSHFDPVDVAGQRAGERVVGAVDADVDADDITGAAEIERVGDAS